MLKTRTCKSELLQIYKEGVIELLTLIQLLLLRDYLFIYDLNTDAIWHVKYDKLTLDGQHDTLT